MIPIVKTVRDLGPQFTDNSNEMVGQDGAYSIPLDGNSLWFFGDTLIGQRLAGKSLWYLGEQPVGPCDMSGKGSIKKMLNNSGLILKEKTGRYGLRSYRYICDDSGGVRQLVPRLPSEHPDRIRIWCLHGCCISNRVYLYFVKVKMLESGPFPVNFDVVGSGLAAGDKRQLRFHRVSSGRHLLYWRPPEPLFGATVLADPQEEWLYVYGVIQDTKGIQRCYIARVKPGYIEKKEHYEYLESTKPLWSSFVSHATSIMQDMPNEMSVSFNRHLNCFLAVHSLDLTGKIVGRTAPNPWGPWSEPFLLHNVTVKRKKPLPYPPLVYAGKEHPELSERGEKTIYITYVEFEEYFPHLVEIGFE